MGINARITSIEPKQSEEQFSSGEQYVLRLHFINTGSEKNLFVEKVTFRHIETKTDFQVPLQKERADPGDEGNDVFRFNIPADAPLGMYSVIAGIYKTETDEVPVHLLYDYELYNAFEVIPTNVPTEYPKDIKRGAYTISVNNSEQEKQAKEFLGIEPPGEDLDTWLSKRDLEGLRQWRDYWSEVFSKIGLIVLIDFIVKKFNEYKAKLEPEPEPEPEEEKTWWEKMVEFILGLQAWPFGIKIDPLKQAYQKITGKELTELEWLKIQAKALDWILPMNVVSKLFFGKNLNGDPEEFGSAGDWTFVILSVAAFAVPGPADDIAVRLSSKTITKAEAAKLTAQLGKKEIVADLIKRVRLHPETSAKFLSKFPQPVREAVVSGLYSTPWGKVAAVTLSKMGYFKMLEPWWKSTLGIIGLSAGAAGLFIGAVESYPFAGFLKEEALQTLGFGVKAATENKDAVGLRTALNLQWEILNPDTWAKILSYIPYVNVLDVLRDFYAAAKTKLDIDEAGFEAKKEEWEEEAAPKGILKVSPMPADAKVSVDKLPYVTDAFEKLVDYGTYHVLVSKHKYISQDKYITISTPEGESWEPVLEKEPEEEPEEEEPEELPPEEVKGKLTISVIPADAVIEIAGQPDIVESGTYELSPGSYSVKASKEGFISQTKIAYVNDKKDTVVSFILQEVEPPEELPTKSTIFIESEPTNSDIYIDGKYTFTKTPYTTILEAGTYIIRVQAAGYYPQEASVTFGEGDEVTVPFFLEEIPEEVIPTVTYTPYEPWQPEYQPTTYYTPSVTTTPYLDITIPDYSLLEAPGFKPVIEPVYPSLAEKEILIIIETTDLNPWKGKIFSIAWKDITTPGAEIKVIVDEDEKGMLEAFMNEFEAGNYKTILGYNLKFDYQWLFNKLMLYRMPAKKFYETDMRDVYQLMSQIKEEFVYNARASGKLDDYGKELLGIGKYGDQETLLRRFTSGDFNYVEAFQLRQIEITQGLYQLFNYCSSQQASEPIPSITSPSLGPETSLSTETPIQTGQKQCANCLAYNPITATQCEVCSGTTFK